jgi:hypothetical protein
LKFKKAQKKNQTDDQLSSGITGRGTLETHPRSHESPGFAGDLLHNQSIIPDGLQSFTLTGISPKLFRAADYHGLNSDWSQSEIKDFSFSLDLCVNAQEPVVLQFSRITFCSNPIEWKTWKP